MKDWRNTVMETAYSQLQSSFPMIWLIEASVPSTPRTRFRLTNYSTQVTRGTDSTGAALIWYPFPVAFGELREQKKGNLDEITLNVSNATLELMSTLELYGGLVDEDVVIKLVHSQGLSDPAAERRFDGTITHLHVEADVLTFTVSATNLLQRLFPRNRLMAFDCIHKSNGGFGGAGCGYVIPASPTNVVGGGFDFCGGTIEDCRERGDDEVDRSLPREHPLRFGGCPGIRLGVS